VNTGLSTVVVPGAVVVVEAAVVVVVGSGPVGGVVGCVDVEAGAAVVGVGRVVGAGAAVGAGRTGGRVVAVEDDVGSSGPGARRRAGRLRVGIELRRERTKGPLPPFGGDRRDPCGPRAGPHQRTFRRFRHGARPDGEDRP